MQLRKLDLVPLLFFLGRKVIDLRFVKVAHNFKNITEAKLLYQWWFRICYHSFPERFITATFAISNHYSCECKSTSIDWHDRPSIHPWRAITKEKKFTNKRVILFTIIRKHSFDVISNDFSFVKVIWTVN